MVTELIALTASRSHGSDATAEGYAAGTGPAAAADGGNPSAASADSAAAASASAYATAAAGPTATRCNPNSDSSNGETVSASAVEHERVRYHRNVVGRRTAVAKLVVENQHGCVRDERRIGGNIGLN